MAGLNIPGVTDQYNTNDTVEKLMKIERVPLTREQNQLETLKTEKNAWRDINSKLTSLRDNTKTLYSFENPFNSKLTSSTEEYAVKNNFILSSLTTDSEPEITVYYDPNDYSHSKLVHTSKSVNAIFILMIIGGASLLIVALAEIFMLKNGFYCVEQNCGKEVLRRNENVTISWR